MPENFISFITLHPWIIAVAAAWTLLWKGLALWKAAMNQSKIWFVILLILNTLGILEIIYILFFSRKKFPPQEIAVNGLNNIERRVLDMKRDQL